MPHFALTVIQKGTGGPAQDQDGLIQYTYDPENGRACLTLYGRAFAFTSAERIEAVAKEGVYRAALCRNILHTMLETFPTDRIARFDLETLAKQWESMATLDPLASRVPQRQVAPPQPSVNGNVLEGVQGPPAPSAPAPQSTGQQNPSPARPPNDPARPVSGNMLGSHPLVPPLTPAPSALPNTTSRALDNEPSPLPSRSVIPPTASAELREESPHTTPLASPASAPRASQPTSPRDSVPAQPSGSRTMPNQISAAAVPPVSRSRSPPLRTSATSPRPARDRDYAKPAPSLDLHHPDETVAFMSVLDSPAPATAIERIQRLCDVHLSRTKRSNVYEPYLVLHCQGKTVRLEIARRLLGVSEKTLPDKEVHLVDHPEGREWIREELARRAIEGGVLDRFLTNKQPKSSVKEILGAIIRKYAYTGDLAVNVKPSLAPRQVQAAISEAKAQSAAEPTMPIPAKPVPTASPSAVPPLHRASVISASHSIQQQHLRQSGNSPSTLNGALTPPGTHKGSSFTHSASGIAQETRHGGVAPLVADGYKAPQSDSAGSGFTHPPPGGKARSTLPTAASGPASNKQPSPPDSKQDAALPPAAASSDATPVGRSTPASSLPSRDPRLQARRAAPVPAEKEATANPSTAEGTIPMLSNAPVSSAHVSPRLTERSLPSVDSEQAGTPEKVMRVSQPKVVKPVPAGKAPAIQPRSMSPPSSKPNAGSASADMAGNALHGRTPSLSERIASQITPPLEKGREEQTLLARLQSSQMKTSENTSAPEEDQQLSSTAAIEQAGGASLLDRMEGMKAQLRKRVAVQRNASKQNSTEDGHDVERDRTVEMEIDQRDSDISAPATQMSTSRAEGIGNAASPPILSEEHKHKQPAEQSVLQPVGPAEQHARPSSPMEDTAVILKEPSAPPNITPAPSDVRDAVAEHTDPAVPPNLAAVETQSTRGQQGSLSVSSAEASISSNPISTLASIDHLAGADKAYDDLGSTSMHVDVPNASKQPTAVVPSSTEAAQLPEVSSKALGSSTAVTNGKQTLAPATMPDRPASGSNRTLQSVRSEGSRPETELSNGEGQAKRRHGDGSDQRSLQSRGNEDSLGKRRKISSPAPLGDSARVVTSRNGGGMDSAPVTPSSLSGHVHGMTSIYTKLAEGTMTYDQACEAMYSLSLPASMDSAAFEALEAIWAGSAAQMIEKASTEFGSPELVLMPKTWVQESMELLRKEANVP